MAQQWYCQISGKQYGPLSPQQLKQLAATGKLKPEDGVRRESDKKWAPASKVKGLFADAAPQPKQQATPQSKSTAASAAKPSEKTASPASKKSGDEGKPTEELTLVEEAGPWADDDDDDIMLAPVEPAVKRPELSTPIPAAPTKARRTSSRAGSRPHDETAEPLLADDGLNYIRVLATAVTGVALGFAAICLAKIPILPLMAGALGIVFAFRAFALSKRDRNAIGLALVAVILSLAGFFWGLGSTLADRQAALTIQEIFGLVQPPQGSGTLQAKRDIGELGGLDVSIPEAYVGIVPGVPDSKYYVIISLRLANGSNLPINYRSWSRAKNGALLEDKRRGEMYGIVTDKRIKGQLALLTLQPGSTRKDVLVFENPSGFRDTLELTLSGRAIGSDDKLVFTIPHTVDDFKHLDPDEKKPKRSSHSKTTVEVSAEKKAAQEQPTE